MILGSTTGRSPSTPAIASAGALKPKLANLLRQLKAGMLPPVPDE